MLLLHASTSLDTSVTTVATRLLLLSSIELVGLLVDTILRSLAWLALLSASGLLSA